MSNAPQPRAGLSDAQTRAGQSDGNASPAAGADQNRLLITLEQLLAVEVTSLDEALNEAANLISDALGADKTDAFLYDPSNTSLVARGTSDTPMGALQWKLGLNVLAIANGGTAVRVFTSGETYFSGHLDEDPEELPGIKGALGVRSTIAVPFIVGDKRRGVFQVCSAQPDRFTEDDVRFLQAGTRWVGMIAQRAELAEQMAQEVARQATRATAEELIEVLAHDVNNYLTPLAGWITIIRQWAEREGNEKLLRPVNSLDSVAVRLRGLVDDLLDVRRLQYGLFALSIKPFDIVALIRETIEPLQSSKSPVLLRVNPLLAEEAGTEDVALVVQGDQARIRQALENLLSNAIRYSPPDAPVTVEIDRTARDDRAWAAITIEDKGPGIPEDRRSTLFSRYAPGSESSGLGLGLYMAHSIAEAHGGTITVDSKPGQGARFCLEFPI